MRPPLATHVADDFQTPPSAVIPLVPYLERSWVVWEWAAIGGVVIA